jgi:uncharacterized membrane protein YbhN (UPF0104 family)
MYWKKLKPYLAIVVIFGTISLFIYFFIRHPEVRHGLANASPTLIAQLLLLYILGVGALAMINIATVRLCNIKMTGRESLLLTMYSSIINFFGPLQSGPAFRAIYLKKKYELNLKRYGVATLVYYFFFAGFSCMFLLSSLLKWWLVPLALSGLLLAWQLPKIKPFKSRLAEINLHNWYYLAFAANILDRTVYIVLLIILAVFVFGTHASRKLKKTATD